FAAVPFEATAVVAVASGYRASRAALGPREDEPVPSLRIVLHAAPAVEGEVVDADGMPIHARIVACEGKPFEAQVESGDDGAFQLPPSTVGCAAFALHADMAPSETVPIAEGRRLTLRLGAPGAIAGFVVDDRGQSVDTFSVGIESFVPAHGFVAPPRGTTAFEDGRFRLEHLIPGTYVLTAVTAGRPPVRSDKVVVRSGATTDGVKLVIARGGAIEGRVLDEDHLPIADVELRFDSVSAVAKSDAFTKTDASGRYRLEGAPAGPLTVSAHKDGYRHTLVSGLVVASGATTTKDITLSKGSGFALSGIGANVGHNGDGLAFAGILPGDPAELAGLHPGDRILRIDGEEVGGMSLEDTIQRLRGEPGTVVGITVERSGALVDVTLTRAAVVH
ncbi:MAG: carboxypeptidase regulatory-like domain-containing protein, partial [Polyangiaceae bacterium]